MFSRYYEIYLVTANFSGEFLFQKLEILADTRTSDIPWNNILCVIKTEKVQ